MKEELKRYLEVQPLARERKNKDRGIVNVLLNHYPELKEVDKTILVGFVKAHNSADRLWRQILEQNEDLRGKDYGDKDILVEEKLEELGYRPTP